MVLQLNIFYLENIFYLSERSKWPKGNLTSLTFWGEAIVSHAGVSSPLALPDSKLNKEVDINKEDHQRLLSIRDPCVIPLTGQT